MVKVILKYCLLVALVCGLVVSVMLSNIEADNTVCTKLDIDITNIDSVNFLNEHDIRNVIKSYGLNPLGKKKCDIKIQALEDSLNRYRFLEYAECMILNDEKVHIEVKQLVPVMRVFSSKGSYYVNKDGKSINTDARYTVDVPVVHGDFDNKKFKYSDIMPLVNYINSSKEISNYVTYLKVKDKNNIFIIPSIGGHVVNFGSVENIDSKFSKLKKFYKEVIPVRGWNYYDTISVKWDYQVVASLRNKPNERVVAIEEDVDEPDADIGTMSVTEESYKEEKPVKKEKVKDKNRDKTGKNKKDSKKTESDVEKKKPTEEEVAIAKAEAEIAKAEAEKAKADAEKAKAEAEIAKIKAETEKEKSDIKEEKN